MRTGLFLSTAVAAVSSALCSVSAFACLQAPAATAIYQSEIAANLGEFKTTNDAANQTFAREVSDAAKTRDAKLSALPEGQRGDISGELYSAAIHEYNDMVDPGGPIHQEWQATMATAQALYTSQCDAAAARYNANVCR